MLTLSLPPLSPTPALSFFLPLAGILVALDGYMNIAMEQTEEFSDGVMRAKYGDAMIRGNNVLYISTGKKKAAA